MDTTQLARARSMPRRIRQLLQKLTEGYELTLIEPQGWVIVHRQPPYWQDPIGRALVPGHLFQYMRGCDWITLLWDDPPADQRIWRWRITDTGRAALALHNEGSAI